MGSAIFEDLVGELGLKNEGFMLMVLVSGRLLIRCPFWLLLKLCCFLTVLRVIIDIKLINDYGGIAVMSAFILLFATVIESLVKLFRQGCLCFLHFWYLRRQKFCGTGGTACTTAIFPFLLLASSECDNLWQRDWLVKQVVRVKVGRRAALESIIPLHFLTDGQFCISSCTELRLRLGLSFTNALHFLKLGRGCLLLGEVSEVFVAVDHNWGID